MIIYYKLFFIIVFCLVFSNIYGLSPPAINQFNTNFQVGRSQLVASGSLSTTFQTITIAYSYSMSSSILNATLSILGTHYTMDDLILGYQVNLGTTKNMTHLQVNIKSHSATNPLTLLRISYMVTTFLQIRTYFTQFIFNPAFDCLININLISVSCPDFKNRNQIKTLPHDTLNLSNTFHVLVYITGFSINDYQNGDGNGFGLALKNINPSSTFSEVQIVLNSRAFLNSISISYITLEQQLLNPLNDKIIRAGKSSVGCFYISGGCLASDPANINYTITTVSTTQTSFFTSTFYLGISQFQGEYNGNPSFSMKYDVVSSQISTTIVDAYQSTFTYTGNSIIKFSGYYSYLIIIQVRCDSTSIDKYFVYGANLCDSHCNYTIGQYSDLNNKCQLCALLCYKCVNQSYICTACYSQHNRVLNGTNCSCDPIGYYDNFVYVCEKCHYSCQGCLGPSFNQCTSCMNISLSYRNMTILGTQCACLPRYYDNGTQQCVACYYTCYTCSGPGANQCLSCDPNDNRIKSGTNTCDCIISAYQNGTLNHYCPKCHYTCETCTNSTNVCLTCNSVTWFRYNSSSTCSCIDGYYDDGTSICKPCDMTCKTCNGPAASNCLSCEALNLRTLQSNGTCQCNIQYYQQNTTCYSCHYSCYTCTNTTAISCLTCNNYITFRYFNILNSSCPCSNGYVDTGGTVCAICDRTCLTCTVSQNTCVTCDLLNNRILSVNMTACDCMFGYVDTLLANGTCLKCHYSCVTCVGTSSTQCSTCNTAIRTYLAPGKCLCPSNQYDNKVNQTCGMCHPQCLTCQNQYQNTCLSCSIAYFRQILTLPSSGPCNCLVGYYQVSNSLTCQLCHFSCLTCSLSSTNCTSCDSLTEHRFLSINSQCLCQLHYYQINTNSCAICYSTCQNCSIISTNCTSCYTDRYLSLSVSGNKCFCNLGTYEDLFLVCKSCDYSCQTCITTATTCLTCPLNSYRTFNSSTSFCPCDFGYYDTNNKVCSKCPYYCQGCIGPLIPQCIACPSLSFRTLQPDKNCTCNFGYYDDGYSTICKPCKTTCQSCTSYSVCSTCYPLALQFRQLVNGVCKCIKGYYDDLFNTVCQICHLSCLTCSEGLSYNCLTCQINRSFQIGTSTCPCSNGYYQSSNTCYLCDAKCLTCSNSALNCTSCNTSIRYFFNNQCLCNQGFYQNTGSCFSCDIRCKTCSLTSTNCITCNPLHLTYLNVSDSTCICQAGQFQNTSTYVCTPCNFKCLTCNGPLKSNCLTCDTINKKLSYNSITFTCDCIDGYYQNKTVNLCQICHLKCLKCYGPSNFQCLQCHPGDIKIGSNCQTPTICFSGTFYYQGQCISSCPNNTYSNVNICSLCINNCRTCLSSIFCTSCIEGYYFNSTSNTCTLTCPSATFMNHSTLSCESCPMGCLICNQRFIQNLILGYQIVCSQCSASWYLFNYSNCVNSTFCSFPNYIIEDIFCLPCQFPCKTCNSLLSNGCLTCATNYILFNSGQCLLQCPFGYYIFTDSLTLLKTCHLCQNNCLKCSGNGCDQCNFGFYLKLDKSKCIPNGYFQNKQLNKEQKCHPNCFSCTNISFSSCLSCQKFRGDQMEMAISGYCECWPDSLDLGNGICSYEQFQYIQTYTKTIKSFSDSLYYFNLITSLASLNFLPTGFFLIYVQSYSTLYFLNASTVLQTDLILKQYFQSKNINFYLNKEKDQLTEQNQYSSNIHRSRRFLVTIQNDLSLFTRGNNYNIYLFNWAIYTIIVICFTWIFIIFIKIILYLNLCFIKQSENAQNLIKKIKNILQESFLILIHLITISEISLYGTASFKFILNKILNESQHNLSKEDKSDQINWISLSLSGLVYVYYIGYILRLIIGVIILKNKAKQQKSNEQQISKKQQLQNQKVKDYRLRILFHLFDNQRNIISQKSHQIKQNSSQTSQTQSISSRIQQSPQNKNIFFKNSLFSLFYIPFILIRLSFNSILIMYFSQKPILQIYSTLGLFVIWFIYSLVFCPYSKVDRVFIHLNQIVMIGQISMLMYSGWQDQGSRIFPAYIILGLNGLQLIIFSLFSIVLLFKFFTGFCNKNTQKNNKIQNLYLDCQNVNNLSQGNLNLNLNETQKQNQFNLTNQKLKKQFKSQSSNLKSDSFKIIQIFQRKQTNDQNYIQDQKNIFHSNLIKYQGEEDSYYHNNADQNYNNNSISHNIQRNKNFITLEDNLNPTNAPNIFKTNQNNLTQQQKQINLFSEDDFIIRKKYRAVKKRKKAN